jgi:hypothetical protein
VAPEKLKARGLVSAKKTTMAQPKLTGVVGEVEPAGIGGGLFGIGSVVCGGFWG